MKTKLLVLKIGGNVLDNPTQLKELLREFAKIEHPKILVHGGGKIATQIAEKLGISSEFIEGRRITKKEHLEVATMVYAGLINKNIVAELQAYKCVSLGMTGADLNAVSALKRNPVPIDFGWVGDIVEVNSEIINALVLQKICPVFCAISHDNKGNLLNTNADTMASEIAISLTKYFQVELKICFEKRGVLQNVDVEESFYKCVNLELFESLKTTQKVKEGMLPKLDNCFKALQHKVTNVAIGNPEFILKPNENYTKIIL